MHRRRKADLIAIGGTDAVGGIGHCIIGGRGDQSGWSQAECSCIVAPRFRYIRSGCCGIEPIDRTVFEATNSDGGPTGG